ncbi:hypothetical protein CP061683_0119B, partial [Chlamydia psittaci 06-1683]
KKVSLSKTLLLLQNRQKKKREFPKAKRPTLRKLNLRMFRV